MSNRFMQVKEYERRAVNALAHDERRADQSEQAGILLGAVRHRLLQPGVVAARRDLGHAAQDLDA